MLPRSAMHALTQCHACLIQLLLMRVKLLDIQPEANAIRNYSCNLQTLMRGLWPFRPILMFVAKAKSLPESKAPEILGLV